jgi:hypothetical protein
MEAVGPSQRHAHAAAVAAAIDEATGHVVAYLRDSEVRPILLKGPAIARWLYRPGEVRVYTDIDLLVGPEQFDLAGETLEQRGFELFPVAGVEHAETWVWRPGRLIVELHRGLPGVEAATDRVWAELSRGTETLDVGGIEVEALGLPARAMHVALHVAQHGTEADKPLEDLSRAIQQAPLETWKAAAAVAERVEAVGAFATGIRVLPEGRRLADELSLPHHASARTLLAAGDPPPASIGLARVATTPGLAAKGRLLQHKVFPAPAFMRLSSRLARRGPLGLAASYVVRLGWLARRSGPALRAWRRARQEARRPS